MPAQPSRGEVWYANLDPPTGHEQAGERPVLIISTNSFNYGPGTMIVIVPFTRKKRVHPLHVEVDAPEGGLTARSYLLCPQIRAISKARLRGGPVGSLTPETMSEVEDRLRILLDF